MFDGLYVVPGVSGQIIKGTAFPQRFIPSRDLPVLRNHPFKVIDIGGYPVNGLTVQLEHEPEHTVS
jgi:hypothetical protein